MHNFPSTDTLRKYFPSLTLRTSKLCHQIMHEQILPLDLPKRFPKTVELDNLSFLGTPPRLIRMVAIAELAELPPSTDPDAPFTARYGVWRLTEHPTQSWLYWLDTGTNNPGARTLCSIAPTQPPRRAVQRDPWLYANAPKHGLYRIASPASLIAQHNRTHTKSRGTP